MPRESSLTQQAYLRLREDLLACRLRPGDRLNIKDLSDEQSVSLGAVREALSRLTSEGFVVSEPRGGFRAAPISVEDLRSLTEVRLMIESQCFRRSIEQGGLDWEAALVAAEHRLSRTTQHSPADPSLMNPEWGVAHDALHQALMSACDNPWLLRMREMLYAQSERYRQLTIPLDKKHRDVHREHKEIVTAALARDTEKAVRLLADHFQRTTDVLLASAWSTASEAENQTVSIPARRKAAR